MNIPVLMYHSVSDDPQWLWGHMSCPVNVFEEHVHALVNAGFNTISLQELYDFSVRQTSLPPNPVVLTFDDGYLDNWVYVFPILKRYKCKGTIFVNPDFVDPSDILRPTLDDVATGRVMASSLQSKGFASWSELAVMDASGVMDVQSHALTHTWYFCDNQILDFHHPGDRYPWLAWNVRPECKYLWLNKDQSSFVPWGTPIYTHRKSLTTRRYFPDAELGQCLVEYVQSQGSTAFFQQESWANILQEKSKQYRDQYPLQDNMESESEYQDRVQYELGTSKEIIQSRLHKKVNFLCWPGGGHNETTERIARQVGYFSMLYSPGSPPQPRQDLSHLPRVSVPTWGPLRGRTLYRSGRYLVYLLRYRQGSIWHRLGCKVLTGYEVTLFRAKQWITSLKSNLIHNTR